MESMNYSYTSTIHKNRVSYDNKTNGSASLSEWKAAFVAYIVMPLILDQMDHACVHELWTHKNQNNLFKYMLSLKISILFKVA